jgi:hypothetical protein
MSEIVPKEYQMQAATSDVDGRQEQMAGDVELDMCSLSRIRAIGQPVTTQVLLSNTPYV